MRKNDGLEHYLQKFFFYFHIREILSHSQVSAGVGQEKWQEIECTGQGCIVGQQWIHFHVSFYLYNC